MELGPMRVYVCIFSFKMDSLIISFVADTEKPIGYVEFSTIDLRKDTGLSNTVSIYSPSYPGVRERRRCRIPLHQCTKRSRRSTSSRRILQWTISRMADFPQGAYQQCDPESIFGLGNGIHYGDC
jgi:hypothetical protein